MAAREQMQRGEPGETLVTSFLSTVPRFPKVPNSAVPFSPACCWSWSPGPKGAPCSLSVGSYEPLVPFPISLATPELGSRLGVSSWWQIHLLVHCGLRPGSHTRSLVFFRPHQDLSSAGCHGSWPPDLIVCPTCVKGLIQSLCGHLPFSGLGALNTYVAGE